jgi:hypothetical protein
MCHVFALIRPRRERRLLAVLASFVLSVPGQQLAVQQGLVPGLRLRQKMRHLSY